MKQLVCGNFSSGTNSSDKETTCLRKLVCLSFSLWSKFSTKERYKKRIGMHSYCGVEEEGLRMETCTTVFTSKCISWTVRCFYQLNHNFVFNYPKNIFKSLWWQCKRCQFCHRWQMESLLICIASTATLSKK